MLRHPPAVRADDALERQQPGAITLGLTQVAPRGPAQLALIGSVLTAPVAVVLVLLDGSLLLTFALLGIPLLAALSAWSGAVDVSTLLEHRDAALTTAEDGNVEVARRALTRLRFKGRRVIEPLVLTDLALLELRVGNLTAARRAAGLSVALTEPRGSTQLAGYANLVLGFVEALRGQNEESHDALAAAEASVHPDQRRALTVARACLAVRTSAFDEAKLLLDSVLDPGGPADHEDALARLLTAYALSRLADHYRDGGAVQPEIDRLLDDLPWEQLEYVGSQWADMGTFIGQRSNRSQLN
jgi:hypothetical protein